MIADKTHASEYFCSKDKKHHEVSVSGQKKKCWLCGAKMVEKKPVVVTVKHG